MADVVEVVFTSDSSGQPWSACVWDPRAGTSLMTYKSGTAAAAHTLCLAGNDFLFSAEPGKPTIRAWALNRHEQTHLRMVCPGPISALACSSDGLYCAAGIGESIFIWQTCSGFLVATVTAHFQAVSCLAFSASGALLVSGGQDCQVFVWDVAQIVGKRALGESDSHGEATPRFSMSHHTLAVLDLCVGKAGLNTFMASIAMDQTCKLYSLASGALLLNIIFPVGLTCVAMNTLCSEVFVGGADGRIYSCYLRDAPRTPDFHISEQHPSVYTGHEKPIVCLSVSTDGTLLVSGSQDTRAIIWDTASRQMLRFLPHKDTVTNVFFAIAPKNVFSEDLSPEILLRAFLRHGGGTEEGSGVEVVARGPGYRSEAQERLDRLLELQDGGGEPWRGGGDSGGQSSVQQELRSALKANAELYHFAAEELLRPTASVNGSSDSHWAHKVQNTPLGNKKKRKRN